MNPETKFCDDVNAAFARLQAIRWEELGEGPPNDVLTELMHEFLTRVRQWAAYLKSEQKHAFENIALQIDPSLDLPAHMEEWLDELKESGRINPWRGRSYVIYGLHAFLCWCKLREQGNVPLADLPEPYEPLIQFFEEGGAIYVEHHYFMDVYPNFSSFILTMGDTSPLWNREADQKTERRPA